MKRQGWRAAALIACFCVAPAIAALADEFPRPMAVASAAASSQPPGGPSEAPDLASYASDLEPLPPIHLEQQDLQAIMRRLDRSQAELAALRAQQQAGAADPAKRLDQFASMQSGRPNGVGSGTSQKGVEDRIRELANSIIGAPKYPLVRLSGFTQADEVQYQQDAKSLATLGDVQNGGGIRRARLAAIGKITENTNFSVEFDFANAGRPSFFDVWGEQANLPLGALRVGQFRQPVTMDSWTSVRHLEFLERSTPFTALDPFRRLGIMNWWLSESERTLIAASVFTTGGTFWGGATTTYNTMGDNRFGTQLADNGGVGVATRATHLLYYDDFTEGRRLLHMGGGYTFAQIGGNGVNATGETGGQTWRATTNPETFVGDSTGNGSTFAGTPNELDTGRILAHDYQLLHGEFAGNYGSAHFQSEWLGTFVDQYGGPVLFYEGAYAQAGYFLTGETAGYNKLTGAMDYNVKPFSEFFGLGSGRGICGWGAWEVATRWSYLNLQNGHVNFANYQNLTSLTASNGGTGPSAAFPNPGTVNNATLALNWWWNQYTRVQFNYVVSMLDSQYHGFSRMDAYAARFQVEF